MKKSNKVSNKVSNVLTFKQKPNQYLLTKLLCITTKEDKLEKTKMMITSAYPEVSEIFILKGQDRNRSYYLTFNVHKNQSKKIKGSFVLHRHKETNTLYSINGLNGLVKVCNKGITNRHFPIPWHLYRNSIVLMNDDTLNIVTTKLERIENLKQAA